MRSRHISGASCVEFRATDADVGRMKQRFPRVLVFRIRHELRNRGGEVYHGRHRNRSR